MAESRTVIITEEDAQARKKLIAGLSAIEKQQKAVSLAVAKGDVTNKEATKQFAELSKQSSVLKRALSPLEKEWKAQQKAMRETSDEADSLDSRLRKLDDSFGDVSRQVGQAGDIESSFRAIGGGIGTAGGAGGQQIESGIALISEGFASLEAAPRLKTAIAGLPDIAEKASETLGLSGMTGSIQKLIPGLTGGQAAMIGLGAAAIAVTAVIAAVSLAVQKWNEHLERVKEAQAARNQALLEEADRQNEITRLQQAGDTGQIVDNFDSAFDAVADGADRMKALQDELDALPQSATGLTGALQEAGRWFPVTAIGVRALTDEDRARRQQLEEDLAAEVAAQSERQARLADYEAALEGVDEAEINRIKYAEDLAQIESEIASIEQQRSQLLQQQEQSLGRVSQFDERATQAIEDRAQKQAEADELAALEQQFANEDELAEENAFRDELAAIASASREKLAAINAEIAALPVGREQALAEVTTKGQGKITELNSEFMSKQLESTREFTKQTERIEEEGKRARLRLLEDITERLDDAQRDNNVLAFLQAQRDGQKQLRRQAEDASVSEKKRVDDFIQKQQQAEVAQQARLAQTLQGIEDEKQKVAESFAERRIELLKLREAEKEAAQEARRAAIARYNEDEANERQQAERQAARDAIKDAQDEARFQERLANIEAEKQAELQRHSQITAALNALATQAANLRSQAASATSSNNSSSSSQSSSPFGLSRQAQVSREVSLGLRRNSGVAFASGGIADRPTFGMFGEVPGMSEALIPFKQSEGLPAALAKQGLGGGTGGMITIAPTFNTTVGDIATGTMVTQAIETLLQDGIVPLFENALAGTY